MWTCYTCTEDSHNTGNFMPYSFRIMCGFFNVPQDCEHSRVVRRGLRFIVVIREDLKVLTICRCNYKGSTFSSVILRPWVLVRPESNSRPPAGQTVAQLTEPPVRGQEARIIILKGTLKTRHALSKQDMQEARIIILKGTLKTFHISYVLDVMHVLFGIFVINQGHLNERFEAYKHNMKRSSKWCKTSIHKAALNEAAASPD